MTKTQIADLAWTERKSPAGRFHLHFKEVSVALGGRRHVGEWGGGHPFDLALVRLPPGATNYPYHAHAAQSELYVVISGRGTVRVPEGSQEIGPGDAFFCPPGEAHQIQNTGTEDLLYHVIADNPRSDVVNYPDSGKWNARPPGKTFQLTERDYYDGEE